MYLGCNSGFTMKYDVVIVGAGPSGSTAAKCLAEKGVTVLLIDKKKFPRDKPCGGGLPTRVLKRFPYIESLIDSISYGSVTYSSSLEYKFEIKRENPFLATVLREKFDDGLVKIAKDNGASFLSGKAVIDLKIQQDKAIVNLEDGTDVETKIVIGCDGMKGIIAKKSNLCEKVDDICTSVLQEQPMETKQIEKYFTDKRMVHLFIKAQGIAGYGWIFPKKECINIGIGEFESVVNKSKPKIKLKEVYAKYIDVLKEKKLLPNDFKIENLKGSTLPVFPINKTYTNRVLICGDAAGFINPITGEGIYYAMASGEIVADVVAEALEVNDTSERFLSKYQKLWKNDFGKDLELLGRFNKEWGKHTEKFIRLLTRDETFAKLIIGITGGRISFYKYKRKLILRYIYVLLKDFFNKT